jgi:hypothetical protein
VVTTTSNIHNTFIWGDDFQDATWTNSNTRMVNYFGATQGIQNGILRHQGAARGEPILEIFDNGVLKNFADNYVAEVSVNPGIKAGNAIICARYLTVMDKYESFMDIFWNNAALNKVVGNIWSQISPPVRVNDPINAGSWYKLTTVVSRQEGTNHLMVMIDDTIYIDETDSSLTNPGLALITFDINRAFDASYDDFRVREYATAEPTPVMGQEQQFQTVTTEAASNITSTGATLGGNLNAKGTASSITFDYGTTAAYGSTTVSVLPASVPGNITADLAGLTPDTLYHFRARAVGDVTFYGNDATFTTLPVSTPARTTSPLIWIVIVSVLLILIVILLVVKPGSRKEKL